MHSGFVTSADAPPSESLAARRLLIACDIRGCAEARILWPRRNSPLLPSNQHPRLHNNTPLLKPHVS